MQFLPAILSLGSFGVLGLLAHPAAAQAIDERSNPYQHSPPNFPSPFITGSDGWEDAFQKASLLVGQMTLEEKVNLTGGIYAVTGCSGNIPPIPRLNFPGMCLNDAENGLRATDAVSGYASGISVGASWNKDLAQERGNDMGSEFKKKGVNIILGPVVGPAWTIVKGGRNWEGFSADPYLSGALAAETIRGVQGANVITSTKHYIGNEQELNRVADGKTLPVSSDIDDRTMHELYLWPFQDAVRAGTATIMCSYQRVNNTYACGNSKTLNGLLKGELGYQGFVVSDWGAQNSGVGDALAGLDMGMPSAQGYWGEKLIKDVKSGAVPESRVNDMAMRIIAAWYQVKQDQGFPAPGVGMPSNLTAPHRIINGVSSIEMSTILQGAVESFVLVKNEKATLPLKKLKSLSIFGYSANTPANWSIAEDTDGSWSLGQAPILGLDPSDSLYGPRGTLFGGGGSGAITPAHFVSPQDALVAKARQDDFVLLQDLTSSKPKVNPDSDACIVFGNAWSTEGYDRPALKDNYTDNLVNVVAAQCDRTIVILHNAGIRLVDGFVNHPNVTAILYAHLPGEESGNALISVLWGESNPSGKIPYTIAKRQSDYGALLNPSPADGSNSPQSYLTQGIYTDYKYFQKNNIEPQYEFGYGLSYTQFHYSNMGLKLESDGNPSEWPIGNVVSGGQEDLWDYIATITFTLQNCGLVLGAEVAQLYVEIPGTGVRQLRGFEKPILRPGQTARIALSLTRRDISIWNVEAQKWQLQRGQYQIYVGGSSSSLPLQGTLTI